MKMKLFKVTADGLCAEFITATTEGNAIVKYEEVNPEIKHMQRKAEYICNREDIIPTIDPVIEFKK